VKRPCYLCGPWSPPQITTTVGGYDICVDHLLGLVENEVERRGEKADAEAFASFHGGTAPYPFTEAERQEEQARIQRELK
jgi:hypothetical protein